jgi:hypothetical protein
MELYNIQAEITLEKLMIVYFYDYRLEKEHSGIR